MQLEEDDGGAAVDASGGVAEVNDKLRDLGCVPRACTATITITTTTVKSSMGSDLASMRV